MSIPTTLNPFYVVQRLRGLDGDGLEFYRSTDDGMGAFDPDPHQAMLFVNLYSAKRVAVAEVAHVRVLLTKEDVKEFER